jgi:hypothetical protein
MPWGGRTADAIQVANEVLGRRHPNPVRVGAGRSPRSARVALTGVSEVGAPPAISSRS